MAALAGQRVLVSGASIAGPALALMLERQGAEVTVVERAPRLRLGGQLVDLRGVGKEVLRRIGLDEAVRATAEPSAGLSFVDRHNRVRGSVHADDFGGDGPVAEIEILRGELSRVLHDESASRVDYVFGDRITAVDDTGREVRVSFESGGSSTYDVVVGADGVHSELRTMILGDDPSHLRHLDSYLSFWTAENHMDLRDWSVVYSEPGRSMGMRAILGNTKVMAFLAFRGGPPAYDHRDVATQKAIVRARAAGMAWECAQLVAQVDTAPDFYFDTCSQVLLDSWSRGRVGLVGDAAYCASPLSGHGATIALVGAYVLAGELASAPGDPAAAFARYQQRLQPWIARVRGLAEGQGRMMTPDSAAAIRMRALAVRAVRHLPGKELLMRDQIRTSNGFPLPDYDQRQEATA